MAWRAEISKLKIRANCAGQSRKIDDFPSFGGLLKFESLALNLVFIIEQVGTATDDSERHAGVGLLAGLLTDRLTES